MIILTLLIAAGLILTGVVSYLVTDASSVTALIPAFVGLVLLILGLVARIDKARRHALHAAMAIALLGILGSLQNVAGFGDLLAGTADNPGAIVASAIMAVLLLVLLVAGVRSFIAARRQSVPGAEPSS